ncbi:DUF1657 domain-containing protein [Alkalihalophilus marmarensis]|uniref:DUF1657 domain-containing protein n=1 Tax=Alkalihalophilus marmarensis TaxID=521377 RepID=UPI002DB6456B|nr:DUF1657 domain-containing protein [Alkalihalophilus marmarensis]MEC2073701.1 DUF1657 domain-containing protein [Alkalihalophilus marmarensis]
MTVQTQMQQAIAAAQSVQSSLTQFSLETENQKAKQMFEQLAEQQKNILTLLEGRYAQVLNEEPQFSQSEPNQDEANQNQAQNKNQQSN